MKRRIGALHCCCTAPPDASLPAIITHRCRCTSLHPVTWTGGWDTCVAWPPPSMNRGRVHNSDAFFVLEFLCKNTFFLFIYNHTTTQQVSVLGHLSRLPLGPGQKVAFVPDSTASRASGGYGSFVPGGATNLDKRETFLLSRLVAPPGTKGLSVPQDWGNPSCCV